MTKPIDLWFYLLALNLYNSHTKWTKRKFSLDLTFVFKWSRQYSSVPFRALWNDFRTLCERLSTPFERILNAC